MKKISNKTSKEISKENLEILKRIQELISINETSEYRMCNDSGVSQGKFGMFKNGSGNLNMDDIFAIAKFFNVDANFIYYGTNAAQVIKRAYTDKINELESELLQVKEELIKYEAIKNIIVDDTVPVKYRGEGKSRSSKLPKDSKGEGK